MLDEVGDFTSDAQARLLRFLNDRTYERLGEARERQADVRLIATTNRDLEAEVRAGRFREDLFYRLHVLTLTLPALRQRLEECWSWPIITWSIFMPQTAAVRVAILDCRRAFMGQHPGRAISASFAMRSSGPPFSAPERWSISLISAWWRLMSDTDAACAFRADRRSGRHRHLEREHIARVIARRLLWRPLHVFSASMPRHSSGSESDMAWRDRMIRGRLRLRFLAAAGLLVLTTGTASVLTFLALSQLSRTVTDTVQQSESVTAVTSRLAGALEREDDAVLLILAGDTRGSPC